MRWLLVLVVVLTACGLRDDPTDTAAPLGIDEESAGTTTTSTTTPSTTEPPTTQEPTTTMAPTTTSSTTTEPPEPVFFASVRETTEAELGASWRSGCPVAVEDLRWLDLAHVDMSGRVVDGVLVVHVDHVDDVIVVFERLFEARFPIESMLPITDFDADDDASMRANNSSAFNCRVIAGTDRWSQHAYGGAIDINPLINPWVRGDQVDPPEGAPYLDRDADVPGLIRAGDVVTEAFASIGWGWGGDWSSSLDYQHFSHNGR
ncbi:MAG: M15 family metallopeptidase [Actinomycetota bacterium]